MSQNLDGQLNKWRTEDTPVVISMITEEEFAGTISWFDNYNLALETKEGKVVLFKGSMVYIKPAT